MKLCLTVALTGTDASFMQKVIFPRDFSTKVIFQKSDSTPTLTVQNGNNWSKLFKLEMLMALSNKPFQLRQYAF